MSLRAFAREIGVSEAAVRKAIRSGRLKDSLGKTAKGAPVIVDPPLAEREWTASSKTAFGVRTSGAQAAEPVDGMLIPASTLIEAQRGATIQRERKLRIENDVAEGRLIPIERVTKEAFDVQRTIRENILNLPARIAGELAAESDAARVYLRLEAALREALNTTADLLLATVNE